MVDGDLYNPMIGNAVTPVLLVHYCTMNPDSTPEKALVTVRDDDRLFRSPQVAIVDIDGLFETPEEAQAYLSHHNGMEGLPVEVFQVRAALLENAHLHWADDPEFAQSMVYTTVRTGEWLVGVNAEGFGASMIYKPDGKWYYRSPSTGEDTEAKAGFEEMCCNARCFFTG